MLSAKQFVAVVTLLLLLDGSVHAKGDPETGSRLAYDCQLCHGVDGEGSFETPAIAGRKEDYLFQQLKAFRSGKRESMDGIMLLYTEDRTEQDLADLAAYWAAHQE